MSASHTHALPSTENERALRFALARWNARLADARREDNALAVLLAEAA